MKVAFVVLTVLMGVSRLAVGADGATSAEFTITTKRADDAVAVQVTKNSTLFSVTSPFGISQAVIERTDDRWPNAVVLRLHLKGLESFRASNGKVTLAAAVSSHKEGQRVRLWKDDNEEALLNEKSPLWMDIRLLHSDGKPAREIPLKNGYFEMMLPKMFFEGNPKSITVKWIDFHR